MKLDPTIKLIGRFTVLSINKLILLFFALFWIPITNNKNKQEFHVILKIKYLNKEVIFLNYI